MTNWIDLINFAVAVGGLSVVIMGFILALTTSYMERWRTISIVGESGIRCS